MIDLNLKIQLPPPWKGELFETGQMGSINFLVGPNGSGKSQFARHLFNCLEGQHGGARLLEVWPESHWPGFALRESDVFKSYMA